MSSARYRTKAELYFHCTGILARGRRVIGGKAGGPDHAGVTASYAMRRAPRDWRLKRAEGCAVSMCGSRRSDTCPLVFNSTQKKRHVVSFLIVQKVSVRFRKMASRHLSRVATWRFSLLVFVKAF